MVKVIRVPTLINRQGPPVFFEPIKFHLEPSYLLIQLRLPAHSCLLATPFPSRPCGE